MRYREEILLLREYGIDVLLTLHHFTNPLWFEKKGAFLHKDAHAIFLRFVERVVRALGDIVSDYVTVNEPNVYATSGYFFANAAGAPLLFRGDARHAYALGLPCVRLYAHPPPAAGDGLEDTKVGFAHHMRVFAPKTKRTMAPHRRAAYRAFFQTVLERAMYEGKGAFPLGKPAGVRPGLYAIFMASTIIRVLP
jgi:beta-glucosidase